MDIIHESLVQDMRIMGLNVSNRYSPGYCSWDVSEQQKLFSFFPEKFAGIALSDSCLMNPIKSISGIAGIGHGIKHLGYACDGCTQVDCVFRDLKD
jgi:cobalamin-dependent methionine synthase I